MNVIQMLKIQAELFICLGIGVLLRKKGVITAKGRAEMTELLLNVMLPANIFVSFMNQTFSSDLMKQSVTVLIGTAILQISCTLLGPLLYPASRFDTEDRKILRYSTINNNTAFIGLPIISGMYGEVGMLLASVAVIPFRITLWTAGISLFVDEKDPVKKFKKIALHPCMIACYAGFIVMLMPFSLPGFLQDTARIVGNGTTFLSMLIVGYVVSEMDLRSIFSAKVLYFCLVRMILFPLLVFAGMRLAGADEMCTAICVVLAGVPAGSFTAMMAAKYRSNEILAGQVVLSSTLLSIITLPLLCLLF